MTSDILRIHPCLHCRKRLLADLDLHLYPLMVHLNMENEVRNVEIPQQTKLSGKKAVTGEFCPICSKQPKG